MQLGLQSPVPVPKLNEVTVFLIPMKYWRQPVGAVYILLLVICETFTLQVAVEAATIAKVNVVAAVAVPAST